MVIREFCPICQRNVREEFLTLHHYKPKSQGGTLNQTMRICKCCHENLHYYIPLDQVDLYDTIDKLEQHQDYKDYIEYIRQVTHNAMYSVKEIKHKLKQRKNQLVAA